MDPVMQIINFICHNPWSGFAIAAIDMVIALPLLYLQKKYDED